MHDEFGHNYSANNLIDTGHLFHSNQLVTQAANYPGFETLVFAFHQITGAAPYTIGVALICILHVLTVFNVYAIGRSIAPPNVALWAAAIYSVSPQFIFVDSLFAYESFGLPLVIAAVTCVALAYQASSKNLRLTLLGASVCLTVVNLVVHHLSSYMAIFNLLVLGLAWLIIGAQDRRYEGAIPLAGSVVLAGLAAAWNMYRHAGISHYLSVYVTNGIDVLGKRLTGGARPIVQQGGVVTATTHTPLQSSHYPWYETVATYATQILILVCVVTAVIVYRRRREPILVLCLVLSVCYYGSLPLLFTSGGNAAHRSWAFTFLGLSVAVALGLNALATIARNRSRSFASVANSSFRAVLSIGVILLLAVGGYGASVNYVAMLPGHYLVASDGRSTPSELYGVADWLRQQQATGKTVLADSRTSDLLAGMTGILEDKTLAERLVMAPGVSPKYVAAAQDTASYLVINLEMKDQLPFEGYYFTNREPLVRPIPSAWIDKFANVPWLQLVHRTPRFLVYRIMP